MAVSAGADARTYATPAGQPIPNGRREHTPDYGRTERRNVRGVRSGAPSSGCRAELRVFARVVDPYGRARRTAPSDRSAADPCQAAGREVAPPGPGNGRQAPNTYVRTYVRMARAIRTYVRRARARSHLIADTGRTVHVSGSGQEVAATGAGGGVRTSVRTCGRTLGKGGGVGFETYVAVTVRPEGGRGDTAMPRQNFAEDGRGYRNGLALVPRVPLPSEKSLLRT